MKVKGLDGKDYVLNLVGYQTNKKKNRSELHLNVRKFLKRTFRGFPILEELFLPGSNKLYCDFFIPKISLIVEAHGAQHYEYIKHFHENPAGFLKSKKRDQSKIEWAELNNLSLITFSYKETEVEWHNLLMKWLKK